MTSHLQSLLPELLLQLESVLSTASLNALIQTCRRLHTFLQPGLDARIAENACEVLDWATFMNKPEMVRRLIFVHGVSPGIDPSRRRHFLHPLHRAAWEGYVEIVALLLDGGTPINVPRNPPWDYVHPLHTAVETNQLEVVQLLLKRGAPVEDPPSGRGAHVSALHKAVYRKNLYIVQALLDHGAIVDRHGNDGMPLTYAVQTLDVPMVKLLLENGAQAEREVVLYQHLLIEGHIIQPINTNLLYEAMKLNHPVLLWSDRMLVKSNFPRWKQEEEQKSKSRETMGLLLAYGASKENTMQILSTYSAEHAKVAGRTEEEFLKMTQQMFREAEEKLWMRPETEL